MDSDNVGGSVCGDAGVVVWSNEREFAVDLSESGEFSDAEFGIHDVGGDSLRCQLPDLDLIGFAAASIPRMWAMLSALERVRIPSRSL